MGLRLGELFDRNDELKLDEGGDIDQKEKIVLQDGRTLNITFMKVNVSIDNQDKPLFCYDYSYTFRDYGQLKNFTWKSTSIVIKKSYLNKLWDSREIPRNIVTKAINEGRVYGLNVILEDYDYMTGKPYSAKLYVLPIHPDTEEEIWIFRPDDYESPDDVQRVLDILGESRVIGIYVQLEDHCISSLIIKINDSKTKWFIDKLITVYRKFRYDFQDNDISLGAVLDNLDLYYCLSFGVR